MATRMERPAWAEDLMAKVDEEQMLADRKQFETDCEWLVGHRDELRGMHPDKFIAVYKGRVVAIEESHEGLMRKVRDRGLPLENCVTEVLLTERLILVV